MQLILLDGGPASGKNTLGSLLVQQFQKQSCKAILLDLDTYVEQLNPAWIWNDKVEEKHDQQKARVDFAKTIDDYLKQEYAVIAIGERFLTREDIFNFINRLEVPSPILLYHLSIPFSMRTERLDKRGHHSLIDLAKDQKDRDGNPKWYGYIYENINSESFDAQNLFKLIQESQGLIDTKLG